MRRVPPAARAGLLSRFKAASAPRARAESRPHFEGAREAVSERKQAPAWERASWKPVSARESEERRESQAKKAERLRETFKKAGGWVAAAREKLAKARESPFARREERAKEVEVRVSLTSQQVAAFRSLIASKRGTLPEKTMRQLRQGVERIMGSIAA